MKISREDYYEFHESRQELEREDIDCRVCGRLITVDMESEKIDVCKECWSGKD